MDCNIWQGCTHEISWSVAHRSEYNQKCSQLCTAGVRNTAVREELVKNEVS